MIGLDLTSNAAEIQRKLNELQAKGINLKPVMRKIANTLLAHTMEAFEDEGPGWQKSRRATEEEGQTLQDNGHLKNISTSSDATQASIGTNLVYARIHQLGGIIKPKKGKFLKFGNTFVKKVEMPARPFMPVINGQLKQRTEKAILKIIENHISSVEK